MAERVPGFLMAVLQAYTTPTYIGAGWEGNTIPGAVARDLLREGMASFGENERVMTTEKADAYVQMLCDTPLPVNRWVDPREGK